MESISSSLHVASPFYFLLLIPFALFFFPVKRLRKFESSILLPDVGAIHSSVSFSRLLPRLSIALLSLIAVSLVLFLVSPGIQTTHKKHSSFSQNSRDVAFVVDISGSMQGKNFTLSRETIRSFCEKRSSDKFALIMFSDDGPYQSNSLTSDCRQLLLPLEGDLADRTSLASQFSRGTEIPQALLGVPSVFARSSNSSRIAVLISDLQGSGATADLIAAISYLESRGIKVYVLAVIANSSVRLGRHFKAVGEYASATPHVKMFEIKADGDFRRVFDSINALEPSSVSIVTTETISLKESNKLFLWVALMAFIIWVFMQLIVVKIL